ncbi:heavy metal-responsive transcriptional regulator [Sphaerobacter thermophilus]|uniref:Transcriptional regulator, MerR family n=1 Tax=Sphaerobacter thermophilus (strain ATCC 49802 / DSM 20745 / KCCM 41009 / NCIMB 13125 / S 6022) TaxID=479434 RepID=D1C994_SPHTD|nr:heavy metal-responsive transcriptional regulator [Sphaerobacter thermophilus]ACZ40387.1 transcriptional regulator, MerR family [Sphaerobacter thermophilus DSM 20745]
MRIGELAAELGLNPKTLRYYEAIGLLPAPRRTPAGYRLYSDTDRERLRFILKARAVGLTLEEIREVLAVRGDGRRPCEHVLTLLDRKLAAVDEQLRALAEFRAELLTLRDTAAGAMSTDSCVCGIIERHEPAQRDQTPPLTAAPRPARPRRRERPPALDRQQPA